MACRESDSPLLSPEDGWVSDQDGDGPGDGDGDGENDPDRDRDSGADGGRFPYLHAFDSGTGAISSLCSRYGSA